MPIHLHVNFGGNCAQAFARYQEIFGGELVLLTWSEMPGEHRFPPEQAELIMHAALTFDDQLLMGADAPPDTFEGARGMHANYAAASVEDAERVFGALAEGGEVTMALGETFFSPGFAMCVDRFGIPWMVHVPMPQASK